jgi:hypothetical protein
MASSMFSFFPGQYRSMEDVQNTMIEFYTRWLFLMRLLDLPRCFFLSDTEILFTEEAGVLMAVGE